MSSDAESPRQRTVAELLAAHGGDAATTGRRARRRAAEDAAGPGQAVADAPAVGARAQPSANGSDNGGGVNGGGNSNGNGNANGGANGSGGRANGGGADAEPAPSRNGIAAGRPAAWPGRNGSGLNEAGQTGPGMNGAGQAGSGMNGAVANGVAQTYGSPYSSGPYSGGADDTIYRAPSVNGGGPTAAGSTAGPAARPPYDTAQRNGAPSPDGADDTYGTPTNNPSSSLRGAPYVNGTAADVSATSAGPATWPADAYGTPYPNGAGDTGYNAAPPWSGDDAYGAPYGGGNNGGGNNGGGNGDPVNGSPPGNRGAANPDTAATSYHGAPPRTPDRSGLRDPVQRDPVQRDPVQRDPDASADGQAGPQARRSAQPWSPGDNPRARPTEQMPRLRADRTPMLDPGLTGPIDMARSAQAEALPAVVDEGPPTAIGMAPAGAEGWHRERTSRRADRDTGPPTAASEAFFDDDDENDEDLPAGLADEPGSRGGVGGQSTGQAWAAVVAQWIAGAIGGAALWVGFRFLWRDLPVVALAAAALVTVGLVLLVRALMRNDDRRTTLFAVLVGLLLTVSPALLVLLGR
ncbi:MAG TPA: hypothetical protein VGE11_15975 [Pseudonocardia sp.]